jgi:hypothetical protein
MKKYIDVTWSVSSMPFYDIGVIGANGIPHVSFRCSPLRIETEYDSEFIVFEQLLIRPLYVLLQNLRSIIIVNSVTQ